MSHMWDAAANLGGEAMVDLERVYYREFTITVKRSAEGWTAVPHRPCNYTSLDVVHTNDADKRDEVIAAAKALIDAHFDNIRRTLKR